MAFLDFLLGKKEKQNKSQDLPLNNKVFKTTLYLVLSKVFLKPFNIFNKYSVIVPN